jgi:glycosyltransferase involved in cell wall biosynthesis
VLIVLSSTARRGAETQGTQLGVALRQLGHEVEVVALVTSSSSHPLPVESLGGKPFALPTLRSLRRRSSSADVVVAFGSRTLPACALAIAPSRPFVYRSIGDPREWSRGRFHRTRTRLVYKRPKHVVALWQGARASLAELYRVPEERISVIPNARDPARLEPADESLRRDARLRLGLDPDDVVVATVGSLTDEKDVELAIDAMRHIEGTLVVAGDGPLRGALEARAQRSGASVRFVGNVDPVTGVLHAADALLLTSRTEGMPGVMIEAALCGVPAVATPVGAVPEMLADGMAGRLAPTRSSDDVAAVIASVLSDRAELGTGARLRALERHTWQTVAPTWSQLLVDVANDRSTPR